jgi:hypothetical protein
MTFKTVCSCSMMETGFGGEMILLRSHSCAVNTETAIRLSVTIKLSVTVKKRIGMAGRPNCRPLLSFV